MASADYSWFPCPGCGGEVGVPADWIDRFVECPKCGETFSLISQLRYRPGSRIERKLENAYAALGLGLLSIPCGWTFVLPLVGVVYFFLALDSARLEKAPVPRFAIVGLVLSCGFGLVECLFWIFPPRFWF